MDNNVPVIGAIIAYETPGGEKHIGIVTDLADRGRQNRHAAFVWFESQSIEDSPIPVEWGPQVRVISFPKDHGLMSDERSYLEGIT